MKRRFNSKSAAEDKKPNDRAKSSSNFRNPIEESGLVSASTNLRTSFAHVHLLQYGSMLMCAFYKVRQDRSNKTKEIVKFNRSLFPVCVCVRTISKGLPISVHECHPLVLEDLRTQLERVQ